MSNKFKDINIRKHIYYFCDIINMKNFDLNKNRVNEKSNKKILIYYTGNVMIKDSKYLKINSINPLYLIINKVNEYFEEINRNKYLTLVPSNEIREIIKQYGELWSKSEICLVQ